MRIIPRLEVLEDRCLLDVSLTVGTNINISQMADNQAEGTIAINPGTETKSCCPKQATFLPICRTTCWRIGGLKTCSTPVSCWRFLQE